MSWKTSQSLRVSAKSATNCLIFARGGVGVTSPRPLCEVTPTLEWGRSEVGVARRRRAWTSPEDALKGWTTNENFTAHSAVFHSLDIGSEHEEFFVDVLVATVDVIEPGNFCGTLGGEGGEDEGGGGAEV